MPAIYPDGFLPKINVRSHDLNSAVGLRGDVSDWNVDLNISYGRNRLDFRTQDSLNATYGAQSQTDFYDGALIYDQWVTGLDVSREVPVGSGSLNVAWGADNHILMTGPVEFEYEGVIDLSKLTSVPV